MFSFKTNQLYCDGSISNVAMVEDKCVLLWQGNYSNYYHGNCYGDYCSGKCCCDKMLW